MRKEIQQYEQLKEERKSFKSSMQLNGKAHEPVAVETEG
jgi:hypothetical protein